MERSELIKKVTQGKEKFPWEAENFAKVDGGLWCTYSWSEEECREDGMADGLFFPLQRSPNAMSVLSN